MSTVAENLKVNLNRIAILLTNCQMSLNASKYSHSQFYPRTLEFFDIQDERKRISK